MVIDLPETDPGRMMSALDALGAEQRYRELVFEALRQCEALAVDSAAFREQVRWPLISAMLPLGRRHRITLSDGLIFEVGLDSRIERALLLCNDAVPDHVWEPQTTRLIGLLGETSGWALIAGAYIGDQVLPAARAMAKRSKPGVVHAFEPMQSKYDQMCQHLILNGISNVVTQRRGLWETDSISLHVVGAPALANCAPAGREEDDVVPSVSLDAYVDQADLQGRGAILLDLEGAEEGVLRGADRLLSRPSGQAPDVIFEFRIDQNDISRGLVGSPIVRWMLSHGYQVYGLRDYNDNVSMAGLPIELVRLETAYIEGPPHGFNLFATKDPEVIARLGLQLVDGVSPKLIRGKNSPLFQPVHAHAVR